MNNDVCIDIIFDANDAIDGADDVNSHVTDDASDDVMQVVMKHQ